MKKRIITAAALLLLALNVQAQQKAIYLDSKAPTHDRIIDLLSKMTTDEKISILRATAPAIEHLDIEKYYHGNEALHGIVRPGNFTVFPQAIGLASMWNPALQHTIASVVSDEARARWNELERGKKQKDQFSDLLTFWSPTVNMARDPRWGRTPETYGEDPYLSGILGEQFVKGLQGNDPRYLKVVSTPKHFAANNEEHNRFECKAEITERDMREYYLPAFERCIVDGKAESIMTAYPAINGIPCTANDWLLKKVLRQDWGFNGYVVSDCGAAGFILSHHKYASTPELAAALAIKAGLDLECGDDIYITPLKNAYKKYMVSDADIDSAAYRVLRARMKLGLFDDPKENPYNKLSPEIVGCKEHQALALEAARQSIVLLKNENNTLPINIKKIRSIAVVGINAGNCEFGDYSGTPVNAPVSVLDGIKNRVGKDVKVVYAPWVSTSMGYEQIDKSFFVNGLKAEYYNNINLEGTPKVRTDANINFEPANQAPDPFLPKSPLSIRWSGTLVPTVTGKYTFGFSSDDGCRLYLDDKKLIDSWNKRSVTTDSVSVMLEAGKKYTIKAEYFDDGGDAVAKLNWNTPQSDKRNIIDLYGDAGKAVKSCDMAIAVLGINKSIEREGQDRSSIELPADQKIFIEEIYKANPNTIVVLVAGSSLAINWIDENIPAILNAWYPGEQGGNAVAEVLFGDYNPAGRLPLTYYNTISELPDFNDYHIGKGRTYQYFEGKPLYEFGYGLSYTSFKYDNLSINQQDDNVNVSFEITNTGRYDGDEIAQLYISFPAMDMQLPIKQLKGFSRESIAKGSKKSVSINVNTKELRLWSDKDNCFIYPKGEYNIMIGSSSKDIRLQKIFKVN